MITLNESAPVVIDYEFPDGFRDALRFASQAERDAWSQEAIEAECARRHNNWLEAASATPPDPTPEDMQAQLDVLVAQQIATQELIVAMAPPEVVIPILQDQKNKLADQLASLAVAE